MFPLLAYITLLGSMIAAIIVMIFDGNQKLLPKGCKDPKYTDSIACHLGPLNPTLGISIGWTVYALIPNLLALMYIVGDCTLCACKGCGCCLSMCLACCGEGRQIVGADESKAEKLQMRCQSNWLKFATWLALPVSFAAIAFTMLMLALAIVQAPLGPNTPHPYYYETWDGIKALVHGQL